MATSSRRRPAEKDDQHRETHGPGLLRSVLRRPHWFTGAIVAIGAILTIVFSAGVHEIDRNTEERLLQVQTRQAASVLSSAILAIETPMRTALRVQASTGSTGETEAFEESMRSSVGRDKAFVTASLWTPSGDGTFRQLASVGPASGLAPDGIETRAHLSLASKSLTTVVKQVNAGESIRIAYAVADPVSRLIVYAERALPADRRAPIDRDPAFADLHYAIYFGSKTDPESLSTTDVDPGRLPFDTLTDRQVVPFGDTELTLVATPSRHLGSSLSQWLPLIVLLGGILLTAASAAVVTRLIRSRKEAEANTSTIATLYEDVDSLYGQQRELFVQLQRALLPQVLPSIDGLEFASAYVAGAEGVDIGGDWYSLIGTEGDCFAFVVGDVSGRGLDAVAVMAHARFTLRAYLVDGDTPEVALEKCSHQFDITVDHHMTTALVGVGSASTGELRIASAGHPLPLLISGTDADFVSVPVGPPLGTGPASYTSTTFTLPPGASLIGYTDGLIERRGEDIDTGMRRLVDVAREGVGGTPDELVSHLLETLRGDDAPDDIATLVLRRSLPPRITLVADVLAPAEARGFVTDAIKSIVLPAQVQPGDPVLIVSELVTNSVEAGASYIEVELNVGADRIDLTVVDDAHGWPDPQKPTDEDISGRGLAIVERLAHEWIVSSNADGKSVTASWIGRG